METPSPPSVSGRKHVRPASEGGEGPSLEEKEKEREELAAAA
eukprot:CAMPEP_0183316170 /NCGR_PEP_ID=MMETSP0160_2-20130417/54086_1 /TAXON_ID=2839 ORGANISM="Odontella Sinensis, Strain Grunow 1884" /NCGR_SAMPLE_ID=MMETSP0160_2 /ASSEMBLY_ACC=CAM_ASM_000250 /LENGTH=41 /DNA_ID= /DNA_START= /DNA_END= /DNA_ORIENTATION=